jgi:hypothetical protein
MSMYSIGTIIDEQFEKCFFSKVDLKFHLLLKLEKDHERFYVSGGFRCYLAADEIGNLS